MLTNKRFWNYGDESLDEREHRIKRMTFNDTSESEQKPVGIVIHDYWPLIIKHVPFVEVEPPKNFELKVIKLFELKLDKLRGEAKEFLTVSKRLFVGTKVTFTWRALLDMDFFDETFGYCSKIRIHGADSSLTAEFFARASILNCDRIELLPVNGFDQKAAFNWLHTPS